MNGDFVHRAVTGEKHNFELAISPRIPKGISTNLVPLESSHRALFNHVYVGDLRCTKKERRAERGHRPDFTALAVCVVSSKYTTKAHLVYRDARSLTPPPRLLDGVEIVVPYIGQ